jgi:hypothetical protein
LTSSEAVATGLTADSANVPFPYFGAAGRPEHNHTHGQPLPPKSGFLSLLLYLTKIQNKFFLGSFAFSKIKDFGLNRLEDGVSDERAGT